MGVADDIINGTYSSNSTRKKKKQQQQVTTSISNKTTSKTSNKTSIADQIINGTYKSSINIAPEVKKKNTSSFENNIHSGGGKGFDGKNYDSKGNETKKRTWFNSGAFSDGYNFGDVTKTILGTSADMTEDLYKGILNIGEGVIDTGAYLIGGSAKLNKKIKENTKNVPLIGGVMGLLPNEKLDDISNNMENFIKRDLVKESGIAPRITNTGTPIGWLNNLINADFDKLNPLDIEAQKDTSNIEKNSTLGDKSDSLVQSAGQLAGTLGLQAVGVPWFVTTGTTSFGSGTEEAFQNDATYEEAGISAGINAGADILTEKLSGGISFGGKTLDKLAINKITKGISNHTAKTLIKFGIDIAGEGGEEVLASVISNVGKKLTYEDEKTWNEILLSEEALDEYLEGFIGGAVLGGAGNVGNATTAIKTGVDYDTGLYTHEEQQLKESTDRAVAELEAQGEKVTKKQKQAIEENLKKEIIQSRSIAPTEQTQETEQIEEPTNAQQITEEVQQEPQTIEEQAHQEAQAIIEQINQERALAEQETNEAKRQEIQSRIAELESQLKPLQEQLEAENTAKYSDKITKLENLKKEYTDPLVQEAIDNQIKQLKQQTETELNPKPASQEVVEKASTENAQSIDDTNIEPTDLNLTDIEKQELQIFEDYVSEKGVNSLDTDSKARYEFLKRTELNGDIAPIGQDVAISEDTTDISTRIKDTLGLNKKETTELYNKVSKANSVEQTREILEDYKAIKETVKDDKVKEIRKTIWNTKLDASNVRNSITDYNAWRKGNFGKLRLGSDGMAVDSFYQELSSQYPDYFDSNITNEHDQLNALADFMDNNRSEYTQTVGEISNEDLNKMAEEYYTEVHAKEFNKATEGYYKNVDDVVDTEALKQDLSNEVKQQVKGIKSELKALKTQLQELKAPIKELTQEIKSNEIAPEVKPTNQQTYYHGTRGDFETFDNSKIGQNYEGDWSSLGKGFYFTNDYDSAKEFGESSINDGEVTVKEAKLDINNPFYVEDITQNDSNVIEQIKSDYGITDIANGYNLIDELKRKGLDTTDVLKQYGYDGIIAEDEVMVFDANQIKPNTDIAPNVQETSTGQLELQIDESMPTDEEVRKNAYAKLRDDSNKEYEKHTGFKTAEQDGGEKITNILTDMPEEVQKSRTGEYLETAGIKIIDKGWTVKKEAHKLKNQSLEADYNQIKHANREAVNIAMDGYTEWNIDTSKGRRKGRLQSNKKTKSIEQALEPIKQANLTADFYDYMYNQLNIDRMTLDKRFNQDNKTLLNITEEQSRENLKKYEGNTMFENAYKDIRQYVNQLQDILVEGGILSTDQKAKLNEIYPHYIPAYRNVGNQVVNANFFNNNIKPNDAVGKAKGGTQDILPLDHSLMVKTKQVVQSARVNKYLQNLKNTYAKNNMLKVVDKQTLNENDTMEESTSTERISKNENGQYTATVYENGVKTTFEISRGQYEALKPSDIPVITTMNTFVDMKRALLTEYNLYFATRNFLRDMPTAFLQSHNSLKWLANVPEAVRQVATKGQYYQYAQSLGAGNNDFANVNKIGYSDIAPIDTNAEHRGNKFSRGWQAVKDWKGVKWISDINSFIEQVPRMAEFITAVDNGKSGAEAIYAQDEVTVNFGKGGDWTKTLDRNATNFVNANIQGGYKLASTFTDAYAYQGAKGVAKVLTKYALAGGSMVALMGAMWDDDEEYEELSDYIKQNYYVVGKYGDGQFIKIPKGRTNAVIESFFNAGLDVAKGTKTVGEATQDVVATVENNLAPSSLTESSLFAGIYQTLTNTSWYGEDIVPSRLQKEESQNQYDETTDAFSIWLGQQTGLSPYKINYLLDQSTGFLGDMVLPLMTEQAETPIDNQVAETFLGQFYKDYTADSTMKNQYVTDIFALTDEGSDLYVESHKTGAKDEDVLKYKYLSSVTGKMNELYAEKRTIQNETGLTNSEKVEALRDVQREIDDLAKEGIENYENVIMKSDYSKAGDKEYYKTTKGEWKAVDEDEAEDLETLGLTTTEKNNYFNSKNSISRIKANTKANKESSGYDEDSDEYKDYSKTVSSEQKKEIAQTVINSGLNDEAKAYLYKKAYNSDTVDTIVDAGINIDNFLTYETIEFKADKNSKGKTISGSRKKKVVSYVNKLPLSVPQKAILIKSTNTFKFNDYNREIIKYVGGLDLEYDEKVKLLKELDMTVSNGKVSWK